MPGMEHCEKIISVLFLNMTEKIIGYVFLALGVLTIVLSGFNLYQVVLRQTKPIEFISTSSIPAKTAPKTQVVQGVEVAMPSVTDLVGITPEALIFLTNLSIHVLLLGFVVNIGYKIAMIGTYLVRPIVVDLRAKGISQLTPKV